MYLCVYIYIYIYIYIYNVNLVCIIKSLIMFQAVKCHNTINAEHVFIKDEIVFNSAYISPLKTYLHIFWKKAWTSLSFFDIFHFSKYLFNTGNNTKDKTHDKNKFCCED